MANDSATKLETVFIELLKIRGGLAAVPIVHGDETTAAAKDRIAVTATIGEEKKDGPGGFAYEVTLDIFGTGQTMTTFNGWCDEVETALNTAPTPSAAYATALAQFSVITPEPPFEGTNGENVNSEHVRHRQIVLQYRAKEA